MTVRWVYLSWLFGWMKIIAHDLVTWVPNIHLQHNSYAKLLNHFTEIAHFCFKDITVNVFDTRIKQEHMTIKTQLYINIRAKNCSTERYVEKGQYKNWAII